MKGKLLISKMKGKLLISFEHDMSSDEMDEFKEFLLRFIKKATPITTENIKIEELK